MTNTAAKLKRALCSMVVMLAFMAGITSIPALAASNGIYTATATSHYKHPTTGVIEDSGGEGSYVLGQSMTESALNKAAWLKWIPREIPMSPCGSTSWTISRNPQFQVDGSRNGNFSAVSATVMQEDFTENTTDFRMQVPDENAIIRCNMYVIPMGRDVIFYITVGDLKSGSGDFIASVKVEQPTQEPEPEQSDTSESAVQTPDSSTSDSQMSSSVPPASEASSSTPETSSGDTGSASSDEDEDAVMGLEEFDASGNKVSDTSTEAEQDSSTGNPIVWWVIGGIIVAAIAGGCVWYFCFFRKKK